MSCKCAFIAKISKNALHPGTVEGAHSSKTPDVNDSELLNVNSRVSMNILLIIQLYLWLKINT